MASRAIGTSTPELSGFGVASGVQCAGQISDATRMMASTSPHEGPLCSPFEGKAGRIRCTSAPHVGFVLSGDLHPAMPVRNATSEQLMKHTKPGARPQSSRAEVNP